MTDINRRKLLKRIGAATGASIFAPGIVQARPQEQSVPKRRVEEILQHKASQVALDTAGVASDSLRLDDATEQTIDTDLWIRIPADSGETFTYNIDGTIAEVQTNSNTFVRATPEDDGVFVEDLKMGEEVTNKALQTLADSTDWSEALENGGVVTVMTDDAAAHRDRISGLTRVVVPGELEGGDETLLIAEINENNSLKTVYDFPGTAGGMTTQQSAIDCFVECIPITSACTQVCVPCVSAPNQFTCAPCAVCLGAAGTGCAVKCGAEEPV